jgi:peroxisome-assembly ATPase
MSAASSGGGAFTSGPLHDRYQHLVETNAVEDDPFQIKALQSLERLRHDILGSNPPPPPAPSSSNAEKNGSSSSSMLTGWMGRPSWTSSSTASSVKPIQGVYLHGGVGCGKTFLMNEIFLDSLNPSGGSDDISSSSNSKKCAWKKTKTHFHKFMLRVHQDMHTLRYNDPRHLQGDDLLQAVIDKIVASSNLLCFDEFQVTDVADALILQRLFAGMWKAGCVVVATSNRPPTDLYLNGLQRDRFLPFIDQLQKQCEIVSLWDSDTDYRLFLKGLDGTSDANISTTADAATTSNSTRVTGTTDIVAMATKPAAKKTQRVYFQGGREEWKEFDKLFYKMAGNAPVAPTTVTTQGRLVKIPQASLSRGIARFAFEDLCQKAMGAADYLMIGSHFHTVFVENIPILKLPQLNYVRRFVTFVDSMYECNCKLIVHARTGPDGIFQPEDQTQDDEVFAFARTMSRLQEMSSSTYLKRQQRKMVNIESKASLISQGRAVVTVIPSLGDASSDR